MKTLKRIALLLLLQLSFFTLYSQTENLTGTELCDYVFNSLKKNNFNPVNQQLISGNSSDYPFNIYVNFSGKAGTSSNLIIDFMLDDYIENEEAILDFINYVKKSSFDENVILLFSYYDNQLFDKKGMIYGSEIFASSLNSTDRNTAIIFNLNEEENQLFLSSNTRTSPSWLIKNEIQCLKDSKVDITFPSYIVSQLYSYKFFFDQSLDSFFKYDIPAIKIDLSLENNRETISKILKDSVNLYFNNNSEIWDSHFLMLLLFNNLRIYTEKDILKSIIYILFLLIIFIFTLGFVNKNIGNETWSEIKYIWYSAPLIFLISLISQMILKLIFQHTFSTLSDYAKIYLFYSISFAIVFSILNLYFVIQIKINNKFKERSIDFLILISSLINQLIFLLFDISLFPIFMVISVLSILSLIFKRNLTHIFIFLGMITTFVPYLHNIIITAQTEQLKDYIFSNNLAPVTISLVLVPVMLVHFRVLIRISNFESKHKKLFIIPAVYILTFYAFFIIFGTLRVKNLNSKVKETENIEPYPNDVGKIELTYEDSYIFNDIIRTVKINTEVKPIQCTVSVKTNQGNAILYSDNEFEQISPNESLFRIPYYPPSQLTFNYGASEFSSIITVTIYYEEYNNYYMETRDFYITGA